MTLPTVYTQEDLIKLIQRVGFLPFFKNEIVGFSLEECASDDCWFPAAGDGVWEWKGPVIQSSNCAYGKFFANKAGFISRQWFPDFANFRRNGYDLDALYDDGYAKTADIQLWKLLKKNGSLLTGELKKSGNYSRDGNKGFESIITRLQMECYVIITDFEYKRDKYGATYGWGISRYDTPESRFGADFTGSVYCREPEDSFSKVLSHLGGILYDVDRRAIEKFLRKGAVNSNP